MRTLLLLLALAGAAAATAAEPGTLLIAPSGERTVTVEAVAIAKAPPERVELRLEIRAVRPSVKESRAAVTASLERLQAALAACGLEKKAVTVFDLDQSRETEWTERKRIFKGYAASLGVLLRVTDFTLLPRVQSEVLADDLIEVKWMNRVNDHQGELRQRALADAAVVARQKAEVLATALGAQVGAVVSIEEQSVETRNDTGGMMSNTLRVFTPGQSDDDSAANMLELSVRAAIKVRFELVR